MSKKLVFSGLSFLKYCQARGMDIKQIDSHSKWVKECEGLTKEEMNDLCYEAEPEWMVEVDV